MKVAIIGAGAAGMFAASNIKSADITILESGGEILRKVAQSGGGRCNFTNAEGDISKFIQNTGRLWLQSAGPNNARIDIFYLVTSVLALTTGISVSSTETVAAELRPLCTISSIGDTPSLPGVNFRRYEFP